MPETRFFEKNRVSDAAQLVYYANQAQNPDNIMSALILLVMTDAGRWRRGDTESFDMISGCIGSHDY